MTPEFWIECYGYLGSALVVVSMLMASVVKLRVVNTIGSIVSGSYALIIGSFPLALMNICLVAINVYNLQKLLNTKKQYDLVACGTQDAFVTYFLDHYRGDIAHYFPEFAASRQADTAYIVFCSAEPAGLLLARDLGQGRLEVSLEYSTPTYRDCSVGKFLYAALPGQGIKTLTVAEASEKHKPYLVKMGYAETAQGFTREL